MTNHVNYDRAAELGSILAHSNLTGRYYNLEGVEKDFKKATKHRELAAMGRHEVCRYNVVLTKKIRATFVTGLSNTTSLL